MNKNKKISLLTLTLLSTGLFFTGCESDKENSVNNTDSTITSNLTSEEKEVDEEKYLKLVNQDRSNCSEVAVKYMEEVFGVESTYITKLDMDNEYLLKDNNEDLYFKVVVSDTGISNYYNEAKLSKIMSPKFEDYFKELLPEGSKIVFFAGLDEKMDVSIYEDMSVDEFFEDWSKITSDTSELFSFDEGDEENLDFDNVFDDIYEEELLAQLGDVPRLGINLTIFSPIGHDNSINEHKNNAKDIMRICEEKYGHFEDVTFIFSKDLSYIDDLISSNELHEVYSYMYLSNDIVDYISDSEWYCEVHDKEEIERIKDLIDNNIYDAIQRFIIGI